MSHPTLPEGHAPRPRVLCVDDDPAVLEGLALHLGRRYRLVTAAGPYEALGVLSEPGPFAAIVVDQRMPGMDGIELLAQVRALRPDAVRVLLTGHADLELALASVNEGQIFRFLQKPCPPETLLRAVDAAVAQHRLLEAERVLLEQTLTGAVAALVDLLALTAPAAFGRASRVHRTVAALCSRRSVADRWPAEVAARLSQIGSIQLPAAVVEKIHAGLPLGPDEQAAADRGPALTDHLLARIPRLEPVREILAAVGQRHDRRGGPPPLGARMLRLAQDLDVLESSGLQPLEAVVELQARPGAYDPDLLRAAAEEAAERAAAEIQELPIGEVRSGMVLAADVRNRAGLLLVARGHTVSAGLLARLQGMRDSLPAVVQVAVPRGQAVAAGGAR